MEYIFPVIIILLALIILLVFSLKSPWRAKYI